MKASRLMIVLTAASMLAACAEPGGRPGRGVMQGGAVNKQDVGTLAGAIGGGIIGSNVGGGKGAIAGTIAGTLLGGLVGSEIGKSLDRADMSYYSDTSQRALETSQPGETLPWRNPKTGNSGTITPSNYYRNDAGQYCREYSQTIVVGGRKQEGYGTACRQPDGAWRIVE